MVNKKPIRTRGKIQLSRYFQKFREGDLVSVIREKSVDAHFPKRLQGNTGTIAGRKGRSYIIAMKDGKKQKEYIMKPIHLKKIKQDDKKN